MKIIVNESDLTYEGLSDFHRKITELIDKTEIDLLLDFHKISMTLDSSTIGELMKFHSLMKAKHLTLRLINVNKLTRTVFRLNKLDSILAFEDSIPS
ncbi:anti-sigma factor antagonist [Leptospira ognonensis]|uniref:Anti-sigma factor antagonist n=1 Tax=Leptospira ognonensis TaxID=2484945 RepID=A0A4R9K9M2_9LEPT|nr:STAS domain-containing protein [Leptospira ognonensis]TGL62226.1 anti-sigma factor antagonist [Leptospira ognonensis]